MKKKCFIFIVALSLTPYAEALAKTRRKINNSNQLYMRLYNNLNTYLTTTNILVALGILGVAGATWLISDLWKQKNESENKKANNNNNDNNEGINIASSQIINLDKQKPQPTALKHNVTSRKKKDVHLLSNLFKSGLAPLTGDSISFRINKGTYITEGVINSKERINKIPCGLESNKTIFIAQLKVFNQLKLQKDPSDNNGFKQVGDNCPLLALYNSYCLYKFYYSGNETYLDDLNNEKEIISFYKKLGYPPATLDEIKLKKYITKVNKIFNFKQFSQRVFIIDTLPINQLDLKTINLKPNWSTNQKSNIFRAFIISTSDEIKNPSKATQEGEYRPHWYVVAILKKGPIIQYVVMDSEPEAHLLSGKINPIEYWDTEANKEVTLEGISYNLKRIFFIIELLTQGKADRKILNNNEDNK